MKLGVTYLGNRFVRHYAERDLPEIAAMGCDYVVHTVSEYDLAFHAGEISALVEATQQAGLEAWLDCWGLGGLFAGEAFSRFLLRHPDAWQVRPDGTRAATACPNAPAFRELLHAWIEAAAEAGADAVFFDDPLPAEDVCVCANCGDAQPAFLASRGASDAGAADGEAFRQWSIARMLEDACLDAQEQGLRAAVGALPEAGGRRGWSIAAQMAAARSADVIAVSPLWRAHGQPVAPYVHDACAAVATACGVSGQEPMAWLQAFSIPAGREHEIGEAAAAMAAAGIANVSTWCYRAGEQMSAIRSERPQAAWDAVAAAYRMLKGASGAA